MVEWRHDKLHHDDEADQNWLSVLEPESRINGLIFVKVTKDTQQGNHLQLGHDQVLQHVVHFPVSQLVPKYGQNLFSIASFRLLIFFLNIFRDFN